MTGHCPSLGAKAASSLHSVKLAGVVILNHAGDRSETSPGKPREHPDNVPGSAIRKMHESTTWEIVSNFNVSSRARPLF